MARLLVEARSLSEDMGMNGLIGLIDEPGTANIGSQQQSVMRVTLMVLTLAGAGVAADTEIYRCLLEDGTFAFQEMPCAVAAANVDDGIEAGEVHKESGTPPANDDAFVNPYDEPANPPMYSEATPTEPVSQDRAECQKKARDAIDAIDLEMRGKTYTKEQGQRYLADLLALTEQLRACKQL